MKLQSKKILVTGAAGFIGYHLIKRLSKIEATEIVGIDNINDYYSVKLKYDRLHDLGIEKKKIAYNHYVTSTHNEHFRFALLDIEDEKALSSLCITEKFDIVIHLAAQAGVAYSLKNPHISVKNNIMGFLNVLEACKISKIHKLIYASSSSVYGSNTKQPFDTNDKTDRPISVYAVTKKTNELMAHTYSDLFGIKTIGLRFFTVYGPWGRPDMAPFIFTDAIENGKKVKLYNYGDIYRDFTYIDDIIEGIVATINLISKDKETTAEIINLGSGFPISIVDLVNEIELNLGKTALIEGFPIKKGDLKATSASLEDTKKKITYNPVSNLKQGIKEFIEWYKKYHCL